MKSNKLMGIVFGNTHDELLKELTERRAISSLPFGGRYRLIDFTLSNLVNADVSRVAVVTKSNYQSLMDHLGSGKAWDLARRNGGLCIMPPYSHAGAGLNADKIQAIGSIRAFLEHSEEEFVIICDGDVVSNIDVKDMFANHLENQADITIAYKHGAAPKGENDILAFEIGENGRILDAMLAERYTECDFSLDFAILRKDLLMELVDKAIARSLSSIARDIIVRGCKDLRMFGYKVTNYSAVIDGMNSYIKANMDLLDSRVRSELFVKKRPVLTKIRNEMPTKYGLNSNVSNSMIADGCIIEGEVINSVLFRGVKVGKGSVVKDCVLMQATEVGEGVSLSHVCSDKNVVIRDRRTLSGTDCYTVFLRKDSTV